MRFKVVLEQAEEGYVIYVPSLPGCVSQGETKDEAVENIKEAIEVYLYIDDAQIEAEIQNMRIRLLQDKTRWITPRIDFREKTERGNFSTMETRNEYKGPRRFGLHISSLSIFVPLLELSSQNEK